MLTSPLGREELTFDIFSDARGLLPTSIQFESSKTRPLWDWRTCYSQSKDNAASFKPQRVNLLDQPATGTKNSPSKPKVQSRSKHDGP